MVNDIRFKSYCWSIGTTSYRTDNFNMNIERQLALMKEFRSLPANRDKSWSGNNKFQAEYYAFLKEKNFVKGDAPRPDKDAREKTSGLKDIGLLDEGRNLTNAGLELLSISESNNFDPDNELEIPKDSYLYFKQMLKTCNDVDGKKVRPFVVFLYVISKTKYLTFDEFTYLLPLCVDKETTEKIVEKIISSRNKKINYEDIIISVLMDMDNYKNALELLQTQEISEELICKIGINRKSAKYDKPYYKIYTCLKDIVFGNEESTLEFYKATTKLSNNKVGSAWRKYFFSSLARSVIVREGKGVLNPVKILQSRDEKEFNEEFFKLMHLFKAKATLSDYFDLNRRYFKLTDIVLFEDNICKLDVLPKCYIDIVSDKLIDFAFEETNLLTENVSLEEINPHLAIDIDLLYQKLSQLLGRKITDVTSVKEAIKDDRYIRFNKLIDEKFNKGTLLLLFTHFEERNDDEIRRLVTDNADIPTIFEYVLGIAWYIISNREGDVLDYMKLSLEADLLPKTHAGGGQADIVWKYKKTQWYPEHTLLIEATLADSGNQRRMEMEPVSRHLGEYILNNPNLEAYCLFVTTYLNTNVISDFRGRRFMEYYNSSGTEYIPGMKIIPIQTSELKALIQCDVKYKDIYRLFEQAYKTEGPAAKWYEDNIAGATNLYYAKSKDS